jgi:1-acyl-sn-glycerol-3-phosphate acyltransferase
MVDFVMIGVFGGLYIVPLFAMVQMRTRPQERARVIAANNIINALFMVLSSLAGAVIIGVAGVSIPVFFLLLALANVAVAVYIYSLVPEFTMRFLVWMITHTIYRFRHRDLDRIPEDGPAVLVCNHVSYMDALLIIGACRRPVRFVIYEPIYRIFLLHFIFRAARAIPIASQRTNPVGLKVAFDEISKALEAGEVVCIFPEGQLTQNGQVDGFKPGIERIIRRNPVPVVPLALKGLWGSFFSHKNGHAMTRLPQRFWSRVELVAGLPVLPAHVAAGDLRKKVMALRGDKR